MDDLARDVDVARKVMRTDKDAAWLDRATIRFQARLRRRERWRNGSVGAAATVTLAIAGWVAVKTHRVPTSMVSASSGAALSPLRMPDGSLATPFDELSLLHVRESSSERQVVELIRGGAHFSVVHDPARLFRVEAGPALVDVLGTEFDVERVGAQVRVAVSTGQVQVECGGHVVQLNPGEAGLCPRAAASAPLAQGASNPPSEEHAPSAETNSSGRDQDLPSNAQGQKTYSPGHWRSLAGQGKLRDAFADLQRTGWPDVGDASSLLLAADVARLTHHPAQAIEPLRKMIDTHPEDARASAAAFTLGRVLGEVRDYRGAAEAFAKSRGLDPQGALSQDALAREVEAWSRAGDLARAHAQASVYIFRYPHGPRISSVRQFGGLER